MKCLQTYFSKIPTDCNFSFPLPVKRFQESELWYCSKRSLGKNAIGKMMKDIIEKAKLQRLYTNHCARVTVVSNLRDAGFEAQDIAAVTGHKRTASVERYVRQKRDDEKRSVSQILNESMRSAVEKTLHQQSPTKRLKTNETVQLDEPSVQ